MKRNMILVVAAIALLVMVCAAQAATTFSVTGTANSELFGYTSGQECTFTWTLNPARSGDNKFYSIGTIFAWGEEVIADAEVFSDFTGTGLLGTYIRPSSPFSMLGVSNTNTMLLSLSCGEGLSLPDNGRLSQSYFECNIEWAGHDGFTHPGDYVDPSDYFADFSGTYSIVNSRLVLGISEEEYVEFTPTSLTISSDSPAVPEPMSIMLGVMGIGSIAGFTKLRKK